MRSLLTITILVAASASLGAQSLNVDVGAVGVLPSAAYGAGANQPGTWNPITSLTIATPQSLVDLSGAAIPATLTLVSGTQFDGTFNNTGTAGDDQQLMDDYQDGGANPTWMFSNLTGGDYTVYTYAWAPDSAAYIDQVSCGVIDPPQNCGGNWPGAQTLGVTFTKHRISVPAGGSITVAITIVATYTTINGFQLKFEGTPTTSFCDGSVTGACLGCGNLGAAGNGCANSGFAGGGHLAASGVAGASNATDTLVLNATNITGPGLFFQSNGVGPTAITFGDGMLCASVGILRLGVVFPVAGSASYPGGLTPNPIHVGGGTMASDIKHYQCWYRDAIAFCTPSTFNLTQGITLQWVP